VANNATIIRPIAPKRSDQAARLKNIHHTTTTNVPTSPPSTANILASGKTIGTTNRTTHTSTAATTPGHSLSGFLGGASLGVILTHFFFLNRRTPKRQQVLKNQTVMCALWYC